MNTDKIKKKSKRKEIKIVIDENTQIYNIFNDNQISDELQQYIYNQFKGVPIDTDIALVVYHNFELSWFEKKRLADKIRESYGLDIKENLINIKIERLKQIGFFIVGILLLLLSNFFTSIHLILIDQIFSIFGWVVICELYSFAFFWIKTKVENKRFLKLIRAKVYFKEYNE